MTPLMTPQGCAHEVIDALPAIMQALRVSMRSQRAHELSTPQFRTLAFLSRQPGASLSAVAEHIGLTRPSMSVLIDGLVVRGLLLRATAAGDRRKVALSLTPQGQELYTLAHDQAESWVASRLVQLDAPELAAIVQGIATLRRVLTVDTNQRNPEKQ